MCLTRGTQQTSKTNDKNFDLLSALIGTRQKRWPSRRRYWAMLLPCDWRLAHGKHYPFAMCSPWHTAKLKVMAARRPSLGGAFAVYQLLGTQQTSCFCRVLGFAMHFFIVMCLDFDVCLLTGPHSAEGFFLCRMPEKLHTANKPFLVVIHQVINNKTNSIYSVSLWIIINAMWSGISQAAKKISDLE